MKKTKSKKPFILQGLIKSYFDRCVFVTLFSLAMAIITFIIALCFDKTTSQKVWVALSIWLLFASFSVIKAFTAYHPIYKETQKITPSDLYQEEIYIAKIKKTYHFVSKTLCRISVYTVVSINNGIKEKYYYIPIKLDDKDLEKLKKQKVYIQAYQGTKIIKSYSQNFEE